MAGTGGSIWRERVDQFGRFKQSREKAKKTIDLIGERLIRNGLRNLYLDAFPEEAVSDIDKEIARLQELKRRKGQ